MLRVQICTVLCFCAVSFLVSPVSSQSITVPGDVVAGRPFTLECKITRPTGNTPRLYWSSKVIGQTASLIYASRECTSSIPVIPGAPAGLSGGCQHVNGEEVYTVRIENVTEDTGRVTWTCQYGANNPADVTLDIKVMVTRVILTNPPGTLTAGDPTTFTCVTSVSKPQACISCYIRSSGNVRELDPADCNPDTSSVQTTTRTLTFTASAEENGAELYCDANNSVTDPPVRSQVYTLNMHFGPDTVQLLADSGQSGHTVTVTENSTVTFTCTSGESNPAAVLSWYNNNSPIPAAEVSEVSSQPGRNLGYLTTQRYTVRVDRYLHGHVIRCEAPRPGQTTPVSSSLTVNPSFGPDTVQLRADSGQSGNTVTATENSTVTFTCTSGESNPAAVLSWYNNNSPIPAAEVSEVSSQPGPNLGYLTTQRYTVRVDRYLDGHVIRCGAPRPGQVTPVSLSINFDILYLPDISCHQKRLTVFDGQKVSVSCNVTSKGEVSISWRKDGRKVDTVSQTNSRESQSHVTRSTIEFLAEKALSGTYQITATNTVGTSTSDIRITVIEGQFIPDDIHLDPCINNQATLVWSSGINASLVEFYKLEYRRTDDVWEERLVRNPGRIKLVKITVTDLQPAVLYRFRLQPNSDLALSSYAYANCTAKGPEVREKESANHSTGLSKAGMLGVGVVVGVSVLALIGLLGICVLLRRGNLTWHREARPFSKLEKDVTAQKSFRELRTVTEHGDSSRMEIGELQVDDIEPPPMGHYEDLDTSPNPGPQYEDISVNTPSSRRSEQGDYENATVL